MRIGYGPVFKGYNGRIEPSTLERGESDQMCGVICSEGGIRRATGLVRVQDYGLRTSTSAGFTASTWIDVAYGSATFHEFGAKWSVMGAVNPSTISGEHFIFSRRIMIGGSEYYAPALAIQSDGTVKLYWTDSNEVDHSITSTLTMSTGTVYVFAAIRLDDDIYLYVGTLTGGMVLWASGDGLGTDDYPEDEDVYSLIVGADGDQTNSLIGHMGYITALDLALQEPEVAVMPWPMPRLRSCLLHMELDVAAGSEFEDDSPFSYTITHAAGVTHEEAALTQVSKTVQMLGETRVPGDRVYANAIVDGKLYATRLNA